MSSSLSLIKGNRILPITPRDGCATLVIQCSPQYPVNNVQCTVYSVKCRVYSLQCTVYNVQCELYIIRCNV